MAFHNLGCTRYVFAILIALFSLSVNAVKPQEYWVYDGVLDLNKGAIKFDGHFKALDGQYPNTNKNAYIYPFRDQFSLNKNIGFLYRSRFFNSEYSNKGAPQLKASLLASEWLFDDAKWLIYKLPEKYVYSCRGQFSPNERDDYTSARDAADCRIKAYNNAQSQYKATFVRFDNVYRADGSLQTIKLIIRRSTIPYDETWTLEFKLSTDEKDRIYMSDEALGNYVINNKISLVEAFLYGNDHEYSANPHVKMVTTILEFGSNPTKDDDTGNGTIGKDEEGNSVLPPFCDFAKPLCDFFDWVKDVSGLAPEDGKVDSINKSPQSWDPDHDPRIEFTGAAAICPEPMVYNTTINLLVTSVDFEYKFEFTFICDFLEQIKKYLLFASYLFGAFIVVRGFNA